MDKRILHGRWKYHQLSKPSCFICLQKYFFVYLAYFKPAAFVSTFDSHKVQVTVGVVHCKQLALIEKVDLFNLIPKLFYYVTSFMGLSTSCH